MRISGSPLLVCVTGMSSTAAILDSEVEDLLVVEWIELQVMAEVDNNAMDVQRRK